MILKASQRAGGRQLASHLLNSRDNDHVSVHELRGFVADNLVDAFTEAYALSRGTRCKQFLFSLSLSPPESETVPVEVFEKAIADIEEKVGLVEQPRAVVFHEKEGRRHAHCVWSRIDARTMTAINLPHYKLKLRDIARELYIQHRWKMPEGFIDGSLRNPLNFSRAEWQQAQRAGQDVRAVKAMFQQCWASSDSAKAFRQALELCGYYLAQGDQRGIVAVNVNGGVYAVARWTGVKPRELRSRFADTTDLPSVTQVRVAVSKMVRAKLDGFLAEVSRDFSKAAQALAAKRATLVHRQRLERSALQKAQATRWAKEAQDRSSRYRPGLRGIWDRLTGQQARIRRENEAETAEAAKRDADESHALIDAQMIDRRCLQREIAEARRVKAIEIADLNRQKAGCNVLCTHEPVATDVVQRKAVRRRERRRSD